MAIFHSYVAVYQRVINKCVSVGQCFGLAQLTLVTLLRAKLLTWHETFLHKTASTIIHWHNFQQLVCPGRGQPLHPMYRQKRILSGWWFQPLWKILVSWDYYSQYMEKEKMFQTTNQFHVEFLLICEFHFKFPISMLFIPHNFTFSPRYSHRFPRHHPRCNSTKNVACRTRVRIISQQTWRLLHHSCTHSKASNLT